MRPVARSSPARPAVILALLFALSACQSAERGDPLRFADSGDATRVRITDSFAATVVGTPPGDSVELPREIPVEVRSLPRLTTRPVPEVFWYENRFRYSLAAQSGSAPLIFVIAGTNAGHTARYSAFLQKVFWASGYHVVSLSSPTFPNFMVTASTTGVPGRTSQDAEDLYAAMQAVLADLRDRITVTDVSMLGYSLGGWQSAFVAEIDDRKGAIGLRRVLLINPPVSLYRSSRILDDMLEKLPGGIDGADAFIDRVLQRFSEVYQSTGGIDLGGDALYRVFNELKPSEWQLGALVGLVFRVASTNIAFTADVLSQADYIVPADRRLRIGTSLTPYFDVGIRRGFEQYFRELLYPFYRKREPSLTEQQMIDESSLERITAFLARSQNIGLVGTADDVILAPGDVEFMRRVFGDRATIFPYGGHCGNLESRPAVAAMARFMAP